MTLYLDVSAGVNVSSGLGRYSRSLTHALIPRLTRPPALFYNYIEGRTKPIEGLPELPTTRVKLGYKAWRMAVWMGQLTGRDFRRLTPGVTVFHAMEHLLMPLNHQPKVSTVMTVHDLIFELFPEHHKRLNHVFLTRAMPLFVKRADAIITVSEASKRDLIERYGTPAEKITVVYEAADTHFQPPAPEKLAEVRAKYHLPEQFLLVVGAIEPRKNYSLLVEALTILRQKHTDLKLVVVGSKGWLYEPFFQRIKDLRAGEHVIFPGYVPDDDLPAVYSAATITVMASVYEGFGLPLLEAMASGTPVVANQVSCFPEIAGDGAFLVEPGSATEMAGDILALINQEPLRQTLINTGLARATQFSWRKTAKETLE
ncbi:MAG: glycosyltransferase family 4 protein, partial [Anaerolineae bacterium]